MDYNQTGKRKFRIEVENQFDHERRSIKVRHKKIDSSVEEMDVIFKPDHQYPAEASIERWIEQLPEQSRVQGTERHIEEVPEKLRKELLEQSAMQSSEQVIMKFLEKPLYPRKTLSLSTGEILEIVIGERRRRGKLRPERDRLLYIKPKHWYIKLPFMADFISPWRGIPDENQAPPALPVIHFGIARNVHTGGRTILYFPMTEDPFKLELKMLIAPPGRIEENYHPENLKECSLYEDGGEGDDNVSVGDNGPG